MDALLVFAVALLVAVLVSELASRSVLSTSIVFLGAGFLAGDGALGLIHVDPHQPFVSHLVEVALFAVLFTDGMRLNPSDLRRSWLLPGRALLLGMPLAFLGTALLGHLLAGLSWPEALLLGAVLAPTDPVLSAAIVGREEVPPRLRRLLNVESGLNDGLALPAVLVLLALMGSEAAEPGRLLGELALGVALGIAVPWLAVALEGVPLLTAGPPYRSLLAFAVALLLYALAGLSGANPFLAAFAGGATLAARSRDRPEDFHAFGELLAELLKLAALLVFGALISPGVFREFGAGAYLFVVLVLVAVRPVAVGAALLGSGLDRRETVVAAWFGPKGFASVVYGLLILDAEIPHGEHLFHLVAIVVAASIVAHSSTDVPIARWFRREEGAGGRAPVRP